MLHFNPWRLLKAICFTTLALAGTAQAGVIVTIEDSPTGVPTQGFSSIDLSNAPLGSAAPFSVGDDTVSFDGTTSNQGVVIGSVYGKYAAPITDPQGTPYAGNYFSTGDKGFINIAFGSPQRALALLWGSVDPGNQISFFSNGVLLATVTGLEVDAGADGFQGYGGSFYTLINLNFSFDDVEMSSNVDSFEGAEYASDVNNMFIPEPASTAMLGASLLGLTLMRRRRA